METRRKAHYEAPATHVVEFRANSSICITSQRMINWYYHEDALGSDYYWDRPGYGNADEI